MFSPKPFSLAVLAVVLVVAVRGQQSPQLGQCSNGLDGELPVQCMEANGINYNGTLYVISKNTTGSLPTGIGYTKFRDEFLCDVGKQDLVTPCILQLMQKWNRTQCTEEDRRFMAARGGQFLALMEVFCSDPCEGEATQTLVQCFAAVQVDPSPLLSQNATIITDKFNFLGNDSTSVNAFCNSRQRLFACLSPVKAQCPKFIERLYTLGIDVDGLELATQVVCKDVPAYLKTRECLASSAAALQQCEQENLLRYGQVQRERFLQGTTKPSQYQGRLCETKLSKVDCEMKALQSACGEAAMEQVSNFECTSMPKPCKEQGSAAAVYRSQCQKANTPPPTVTQRPTVPPRPTNPIGGGGGSGGTGASSGDGSGAALVSLSSSLCLLVLTPLVQAMVPFM